MTFDPSIVVSTKPGSLYKHKRPSEWTCYGGVVDIIPMLARCRIQIPLTKFSYYSQETVAQFVCTSSYIVSYIKSFWSKVWIIKQMLTTSWYGIAAKNWATPAQGSIAWCSRMVSGGGSKRMWVLMEVINVVFMTWKRVFWGGWSGCGWTKLETVWKWWYLL